MLQRCPYRHQLVFHPYQLCGLLQQLPFNSYAQHRILLLPPYLTCPLFQCRPNKHDTRSITITTISHHSLGASPTTSTLLTSSTSVPTANPLTERPSDDNSATKIGIGLGVPLGLLVAAIFAILYRYRKRIKSPSRHETPANDTSPPETVKPELPVSTVEHFPPHELKGDRSRQEVQDTFHPHFSWELPGSPGPYREELSS